MTEDVNVANSKSHRVPQNVFYGPREVPDFVHISKKGEFHKFCERRNHVAWNQHRFSEAENEMKLLAVMG